MIDVAIFIENTFSEDYESNFQKHPRMNRYLPTFVGRYFFYLRLIAILF